ncbi:MAG: histone deacetylase [Nitrospinota bacterium]
MDIIYNKIFLEHNTGNHPESIQRLLSFGELKETEIPSGEEYLGLIHSREYVDSVKAACKVGGYMDADTVVSARSYEAAIYGVGAAVMASETNGFALVRPPGHHGFPNKSSGFCIFNNIAIASKRLVDMGKRVFILDFDGHLGDGTEHCFYNSDKVLYWSLHQSHAFPGGGDVVEIGEGAGKGYTINITLFAGAGDDIYMRAVDDFMTIAEQFKPDVVAVSAGFDAHQSDFLLDLRLSLDTYYKIGKILRERFDNIFAVLEGGYNTDFLSKGVYNFIDGINGEKMRFREKETESKISIIEQYHHYTAQHLKELLSPYWSL